METRQEMKSEVCIKIRDQNLHVLVSLSVFFDQVRKSKAIHLRERRADL